MSVINRPYISTLQSVLIGLYAFFAVSVGGELISGHPVKLFVQAGMFIILLLLLVDSSNRVIWSLALLSLFPAGIVLVAGSAAWAMHCYVLLLLACSVLLCIENRPEAFRQICFVACMGGGVAFMLVVASEYFGLVEHKVYYVLTSETTKESLGFFNPNIAGVYAAGILISAILSGSKAITVSAIVLFSSVSFLVVSRGAILMAVIFIVVYFITPLLSLRTAKMVYFLGCGSFLLSLIALFYMLSVYEVIPSYLAGIDEMLSYRVSFAWSYFAGETLWLPNNKENLDFAWANLLGNLGLLYCLLLSLPIVVGFGRLNEHNFRIVLAGGSLAFASLFVENIAYMYFFIGVLFFMPIAVALLYLVTTLFGSAVRSCT